MGKKDLKSKRGDEKTICLPFGQEEYYKIVDCPALFRKSLDDRINLFPELFPAEIDQGSDERHPPFEKTLIADSSHKNREYTLYHPPFFCDAVYDRNC